jgi:acetylornithine deacetylase/succinyl-diaminopimelate desuccinylase-like protein
LWAVVPADPTVWERPPFKLIIEGDKLYGRGTTDCLGHVALITCLFRALAILKPDLDIDVHAVFIASEEAEAKVRSLGNGMLLTSTCRGDWCFVCPSLGWVWTV